MATGGGRPSSSARRAASAGKRPRRYWPVTGRFSLLAGVLRRQDVGGWIGELHFIKGDAAIERDVIAAAKAAQMEAMLRDAQVDGVRSLIVRAGEYFGSHQPSSMLRDLMIRPGHPLRSVTYPGSFMAGHAWCYTPDLAEAIARLVEMEGDLPAFDSFNFGGHWTERGVDFADALRRAGGAPHAPIRRAPWVLFRAASPFVRLLREMMEMRYLWQVPVRLDNSKLVAVIGPEPHTDLDVALRQVLLGLGCLGHADLQAA